MFIPVDMRGKADKNKLRGVLNRTIYSWLGCSAERNITHIFILVSCKTQGKHAVFVYNHIIVFFCHTNVVRSVCVKMEPF